MSIGAFIAKLEAAFRNVLQPGHGELECCKIAKAKPGALSVAIAYRLHRRYFLFLHCYVPEREHQLSERLLR